jgi:hypothetical protein
VLRKGQSKPCGKRAADYSTSLVKANAKTTFDTADTATLNRNAL